eukprot:CAMPEP_0172672762 /NCGR_PEP_ID=MMETSP1074-20121228/11745_1 /TAXON_ID=2916 /ORGANISM="Ceratium fusus, Strain PA161109" /LENGTH=127 /DNA_ID=CAMNT_0013489991 /DNA_START=213 /DNA_END=596 /DNA_ORIENTATION=+
MIIFILQGIISSFPIGAAMSSSSPTGPVTSVSSCGSSSASNGCAVNEQTKHSVAATTHTTARSTAQITAAGVSGSSKGLRGGGPMALAKFNVASRSHVTGPVRSLPGGASVPLEGSAATAAAPVCAK